ncbi:hypothetical protein C8R45DRAFT_936416 [Mycena sanguinolenta]|nr:hypothetical protein C8R45DRAFT_936416 [Mycena sanguinolenta]
MCFGIFGHRSSQYNPDLLVIFPLRKICGSPDDYRLVFLQSFRNAPNTAKSSIHYLVENTWNEVEQAFVAENPSQSPVKIAEAPAILGQNRRNCLQKACPAAKTNLYEVGPKNFFKGRPGGPTDQHHSINFTCDNPLGHPFLIVHLEYPAQCQYPIRLKIQGFDSVATVQVAGKNRRCCTPGERSTFSVAGVHQTMAELVGTRRYDVLHTMTFRSCVNADGRIEPSIEDLLVVAKLSIKCDHTREGYPANLFAVLKTLFNGYITSTAKAEGPPSDVNAEIKSAVLDTFLIEQRHMHDEVDFRSERGCVEPTWITELRIRNAALKAEATLLKERIRQVEAGGNSFTTNTSDTLAP